MLPESGRNASAPSACRRRQRAATGNGLLAGFRPGVHTQKYDPCVRRASDLWKIRPDDIGRNRCPNRAVPPFRRSAAPRLPAWCRRAPPLEGEAQQTAETAAQRDWGIDFGRYRLVESSKDLKPGGRTDHTFVYERQDESLREGHYRLRLVVGGEKLTELTHFVQIPEAFTRRYEQMRASNDAIGAFSQIVTFGLYILGFCGVGLFFMIRHRWVLWRQPLLWGSFIAFLLGLQQLNSWPLLWMGYDTALPASGFAIRQFLRAAATFGLF